MKDQLMLVEALLFVNIPVWMLYAHQQTGAVIAIGLMFVAYVAWRNQQ